MNTVISLKPIDDNYRSAARDAFIKELWRKRSYIFALGQNSSEQDIDDIASCVLHKISPGVRSRLFTYISAHGYVEVDRLRPHREVEGVFVHRDRELDLADIPDEMIDVTSLVPNWRELISEQLEIFH